MGNGSKKSKANSAAGKIPMSDVTHILSAIEQGDPQAAKQLLPLVYDELRKLAAQNLAQEKPGQTLDATALVHEAYLRLVGDRQFASGRHFFAAAAEAMRLILIDNARRKGTARHRQKERDEVPAARCPVHQGGLVELLRHGEEEASHHPDDERHQERQVGKVSKPDPDRRQPLD